jgi:hypothetical protein
MKHWSHHQIPIHISYYNFQLFESVQITSEANPFTRRSHQSIAPLASVRVQILFNEMVKHGNENNMRDF